MKRKKYCEMTNDELRKENQRILKESRCVCKAAKFTLGLAIGICMTFQGFAVYHAIKRDEPAKENGYYDSSNEFSKTNGYEVREAKEFWSEEDQQKFDEHDKKAQNSCFTGLGIGGGMAIGAGLGFLGGLYTTTKKFDALEDEVDLRNNNFLIVLDETPDNTSKHIEEDKTK